MTTHPDPKRPYTTHERVCGPSDLLASVPAFMGFVPHRSLVLICLEGAVSANPTVGTVMRHDLILPDGDVDALTARRRVTPEMAEVTAHFADICGRNGIRAAMALIVDDRAFPTGSTARIDPRFRAVAHGLSESFRGRGTLLTQVYITAEVAHGSPWTTVLGPVEYGTIPDPDTSPVALAYMVEGRGVLDSRQALKDALAPVDSAFARDVARVLEESRVVDREPDRVALEIVLGRILDWVAVSSERPAFVDLSAAETARFGRALTSVMVRDSLLGIVLTSAADVAERLWTFLMRHLPAPERACAASLLAFSAYSHGEGALATVAIDVALDADPDYSLAELLQRSLMAGARPDLIREVAVSGYAVAELVGVRLPPPLD